MIVVTVALYRFPASFPDDMPERFDGLLLRRLCAGHVEDFFLHDRAVQIIDPVAERNLRQR